MRRSPKPIGAVISKNVTSWRTPWLLSPTRSTLAAFERADFDANKSEYLWQLKTESIAGSVYEIQEVTESDLKATGKTILYTAFSLASGELPESVGATIDLLVVEKESGAVVHQWKGITYRTELDELRSSIEQDLAFRSRCRNFETSTRRASAG